MEPKYDLCVSFRWWRTLHHPRTFGDRIPRETGNLVILVTEYPRDISCIWGWFLRDPHPKSSPGPWQHHFPCDLIYDFKFCVPTRLIQINLIWHKDHFSLVPDSELYQVFVNHTGCFPLQQGTRNCCMLYLNMFLQTSVFIPNSCNIDMWKKKHTYSKVY